MNDTNSLSISDLRKNTASVINSVVRTQNPKVILQRSKPRVVLVDVNYFEALEEALLDMTDSKEAEKAKKEKAVPLEDYLQKRWKGNL